MQETANKALTNVQVAATWYLSSQLQAFGERGGECGLGRMVIDRMLHY
jgi:hypothetical protein